MKREHTYTHLCNVAGGVRSAEVRPFLCPFADSRGPDSGPHEPMRYRLLQTNGEPGGGRPIVGRERGTGGPYAGRDACKSALREYGSI